MTTEAMTQKIAEYFRKDMLWNVVLENLRPLIVQVEKILSETIITPEELEDIKKRVLLNKGMK